MISKILKLRPLACCCTVLLGATGATAQEQLMLEEVVVTAQKRTESLSDVPISVNVMSGEKIAEAGITNLDDLSDFVPNLSMNQTGIGTNITIRGISSGINPAFEQSVGMYVDDVYYGRAQLARAPYLDVERVEILRGPQPILFGKNAIAGAISLTTKRPTTEGLEGFIQADYNFDQEAKDVQAGVNIPLGEVFSARIAGMYRDTEGYYDNTFLNRDESAVEEYVIRGSFLFEPTDELSVLLKVEDSSFDTEGRFLEVVNPAEIGAAPSFADVLFQRTADFPGGPVVLDTKQDFKRQSNGDIDETDTFNTTLTIDYALGEHTLTAITGYVEYDYFQACDCDFTSAIVFDTAGYEEFEQISQELRLTSPGGETIDYIVGAFYQSYEVEVNDLTNVPDPSVLGSLLGLSGTGARRAYDTESDLWSVFAQLTWNMSDVLRLTVGGRYTAEDKTGSRIIDIVDVNQTFPVRDVTGLSPTTGGTPGVYRGVLRIDNEQVPVGSGLTGCGGAADAIGHNLDCDRDEAKFTPAANIQWDVNGDIMAYASVSTGFKAGGFDTRANNTGSFEFEEEEALSFELGAKMTLAGGAAELNVAVYRTAYTDLQTSQFDGVLGFNVTNVGEATTQGIELDGRWQATENLLLTGSFAFLDFEFDEFPNSQCFFGEQSDYPADNPFAGLCDRSGDTREFTPEITANVGAQYFVTLGSSMELVFGMDVAYSDDYFVSPTLDPNLFQDSYFKLNGRIALASQEGTWEVALLLENLTDEEILTFGNQAPVSTTLTAGQSTAYYGFYEAPFNAALNLRYNF